MRQAVFIRLLADSEKSEPLREAIGELRIGCIEQRVHLMESSGFRKVPGAPFAYWVSEALLETFDRFPRFDNEHRAAHIGASTKNDFRYLRCWWETSLPKSGRSREDTIDGKRWVPFAKGGSFAPYYVDLELVLDWHNDGEMLKQDIAEYRGSRGWGYQWSAALNGHSNYFRPGLTWPRRTNGLSVRILPSGAIFADKGPAAFVDGDKPSDLFALASIMNSRAFLALVQLQLARHSLAQSFEVGIIESTPTPNISQATSSMLSREVSEIIDRKRDLDARWENSHVFVSPFFPHPLAGCLTDQFRLLATHSQRITEEINQIQELLDQQVFDLFEVSERDCQINDLVSEERSQENTSESPEEEQDTSTFTSPATSASAFLVYALGVAAGRWDIRVIFDSDLVPPLQPPFKALPIAPPGMLIGPEGLPATMGRIASDSWLRARADVNTVPPYRSVNDPTITDGEYPVRVAWDGILVDDPQHPDDLVRRLREVLTVIWPDRAGEIEREACEILGVRELGDYVSNPRRLFDFHLKQYSKSRRKAPIYWPLSTTSGSYTIWLYYPRLTSDTIYTAVNKYLNPKISAVDRSIANMSQSLVSASGGAATRLQRDLESEQELRRELIDMRDELLRIADLPYRPNLDDGVIINAAPFHRLFRHRAWAKATEDTWKKLEKGEYDWAHLAYAIWPDRVRDVCRSDKSIAIAHGLEDLYVEAPIATKKGKGRARQQAFTEEDA